MGGYVGNAPACYGSSLGSQKYKMGDISKEMANTLVHKKIYYKKSFRMHKACLLVRLSVGGREQDHTWSTSWLTRLSSRLWLQAEKGR
jgi:hypothetical protein